MALSLRWADMSGLRIMEKAAKQLGPAMVGRAGAMALNRAGAQGRTKAGRALVKQTGLKRKVVVRAMKPTRATPATLEYRIDAKGGDVALKYFDARETRKGVSAKPFNKRRVFQSTFIKGGRFPNRIDIGRGGHVFIRVGGSRLPIDKVKSGVVIPSEMVKGESAKAWKSTIAGVLPRRVLHELNRLSGGIFS